MSLLPSLVAWQWAVLAAVPVGIVLLYFLKLRRQSVRVPSTFLWAKTIEDLHVNSLLQRLRRNLLLFLQLLAVALAALALLRPGLRDQTASSGRQIFLLDASASMQATDVSPDANRFEQARRLIGESIDAMSDNDMAMLITFSDRADVLQSFTADRRRLREALQRAEVTSRPTDIAEALRAADGLANPNRTGQFEGANDLAAADPLPADLLVYSDGGFGAVQDFELGNLRPNYIRVGSESPNNLAILAFAVERNPESPAEVQAFATVANLGSVAAETTATLSLDDEFLDAERLSLAPGEETGLTFVLEVDQADRLELRLDADDDLAIDNVAHSGIAPSRLVQVLVVTPGNPPLDLALTTGPASGMCEVEFVTPDYLSGEAYPGRAAAGRDDLIIFDRCAPTEMPLTNTFFIGSIPPSEWQRGDPTTRVLLVDIDRGHPIMRFLELFSLLIAEGRVLKPPTGALDLLVSEAGPLLSLASRDGYQDLVLGFEIISDNDEEGATFNTDWHVQRSWPVFVLNLLRHLAGAAQGSSLATYRPGESVTLRADQRRPIEIDGPDGFNQTLTPSLATTVTFSQTDHAGFYEVDDGTQRPQDRFAVNLFDRRESDIAAAESVSVSFDSVEAVSSTEYRRNEYWRLLLVCVLGVITLEWWLYTRRLG